MWLESVGWRPQVDGRVKGGIRTNELAPAVLVHDDTISIDLPDVGGEAAAERGVGRVGAL